MKTAGKMGMQNSIRTILFDFDGTLVFHKPDSFDVIRAFCADIGQPLSAEAEYVGRRTRHEYFVDPVILDHLEGLSREQFWRHFNRHLLEAICVEGDLDGLAEEVTDRFEGLEFTYYCPKAGCHTLDELRSRGYGLGLITNRSNLERLHDLLDQTKLRPYFDLVLASGEIGIRKPDPTIFHTALGQMRARAEHSLYVGDNYWADVVGARRAGIEPVLLDPRRLFPEAGCLVLEQIDDLLAWLP